MKYYSFFEYYDKDEISSPIVLGRLDFDDETKTAEFVWLSEVPSYLCILLEGIEEEITYLSKRFQFDFKDFTRFYINRFRFSKPIKI